MADRNEPSGGGGCLFRRQPLIHFHVSLKFIYAFATTLGGHFPLLLPVSSPFPQTQLASPSLHPSSSSPTIRCSDSCLTSYPKPGFVGGCCSAFKCLVRFFPQRNPGKKELKIKDNPPNEGQEAEGELGNSTGTRPYQKPVHVFSVGGRGFVEDACRPLIKVVRSSSTPLILHRR